MKMPELLSRQLDVLARLNPDSMQISLSEEPYSTVTMVLGPEEPNINVRAWLRVYTPQGESFVAVVRSVQTSYNTGDRTITATHAWCLMEDHSIVGKYWPGGGTTEPLSCSADTALRSVMVLSDDLPWQVGLVEYTAMMPYEFGDESAKAAFDSVLETLEDYQLYFVFSNVPFTVIVMRRPDDVPCEMRLSRNISTITPTVNSEDMYNRIYPTGYNGLRIDSPGYVQDDESIAAWGLVEHTETHTGIADKDMLRAWATAQLARYSVPLITVQINGLDLSESTGEPMDRIRLGRLCRVPLPAYTTTITQRVTKLNWADAIHAPESVTVTLCNVRDTVNLLTSKIKKASRSAAGASRAASKAGSTANAKFEFFAGTLNDHWTAIQADNSQIQLAAQMLTGNTTLTSDFTVTAGGISAQVTSNTTDLNGLHGQVATAQTRINQTADAISIAAQKLSAGSGATSDITVAADRIVSRVRGIEGDVKTQGSEIEQLADSIKLKADKVLLESSITEINSKLTTIGGIVKSNSAGSVVDARQVNAQILYPGTIVYDGKVLTTGTLPVITSFTQALGESGKPTSYGLVLTGRTHEYDLVSYF